MALVWPRAWATVLQDRRVIRLIGAAAVPLLNGLVTSNVTKLRPGDAQPTVFLSAQGRVAADALLVMGDDSLLIDCHQDDVNFLLRHIQTYKLRAKFDIKHNELERVVWHSHKPQAFLNTFENLIVAADPRVHEVTSDNLGLGWRLFTPPLTPATNPTTNPTSAADDAAADAAGVQKLLLPSSNSFTSHSLGTSIYTTYRRLCSVFEGPNEVIRGSAFPLECNFDTSGAVSFDKGCYIGQELTARTKFRGEVRKRMFALERDGTRSELLKFFNSEHKLEQQDQPDRGSTLYIAGSSVEIGRVVSDAISPRLLSSAVALLRVSEVACAAGGSSSDADKNDVYVTTQPDGPPCMKIVLPSQLKEWQSK